MEFAELLQGKGTELGITNLIILFMMLANKLGWLDRVKKRLPTKKKNGNDTVLGKLASNPGNPGNPYSKPGKGEVCIKNGNKLTELNTKVENLESKVDDNEKAIETVRVENRADHKEMFAKIDKLKNGK